MNSTKHFFFSILILASTRVAHADKVVVWADDAGISTTVDAAKKIRTALREESSHEVIGKKFVPKAGASADNRNDYTAQSQSFDASWYVVVSTVDEGVLFERFDSFGVVDETKTVGPVADKDLGRIDFNDLALAFLRVDEPVPEKQVEIPRYRQYGPNELFPISVSSEPNQLRLSKITGTDVQQGYNVVTYTTNYVRLCTAPCETPLVADFHKFLVQTPKGKQITIKEALNIEHPVNLHLRLVDRRKKRKVLQIVGGSLAGAGFLVGAVSPAFADLGGGAFAIPLVSGMAMLVSGGITLLVSAFKRDRVEIEVGPYQGSAPVETLGGEPLENKI